MLSNLLIKEKFEEFNLDYEKNNQNIIQSKINLYSVQKQNSSLIENIDDKNYFIQDNEVKYKIFEDISSINRNNNYLELILNIPIENNIISINKIKLSNKLNKYIKNIYLNIDEKIIEKKELFTCRDKLSKTIEYKERENIINCSLDKNVNLHIVLDKDALNYIMNKNIFVNYTYAIFKNKLKFT